MSINITFHIPNEEVDLGPSALAKRMAVLGYAAGQFATPPVLMNAPPLTDSDREAATTLGEAIRAEEAKEQPEADKPKRGRRPKAEAEKPQISTQPESRVEPEADDEDTAEQDAADEAAEVEATREPEKPLTIDDVKSAMGGYVTKFGMDAIQADGPAVFKAVLGEPPAGEAFWKLSLLKDASQETLTKVVAHWNKVAAAEARFGGA